MLLRVAEELAAAISSGGTLYGIMLIMVISFFLNQVLLLGSSRTEVKNVSEQAEAIRQAILSQVDRGVTILHGEGGYRRSQTEVLLSIVSNHELPKLERLARSIAPACFLYPILSVPWTLIPYPNRIAAQQLFNPKCLHRTPSKL